MRLSKPKRLIGSVALLIGLVLSACSRNEIQFHALRIEQAKASVEIPCEEYVSASLLAGFEEWQLPTVHRVMSEESRCNPRAVGPYNERGLMQVHPRSWETRLIQMGIITSREDLFDPIINLRAAFYVWNVGGWEQWTTF